MPNRTDRIPFVVVPPRTEQAPGAATIQVDLTHFFALLQRIGRDPALLLLTLRATRVRMWSTYGVHELAWMLRAPQREVLAWLDNLSRERLVAYQLTAMFGRDAFLLELLGEPIIPPPPTDAMWPPTARRIEHALPAFWFTTTLPLIGRTPFLVYLLLRRAEMDDAALVHPSGIARTLRLGSARHSVRHLRHLQRHGLVRSHRKGRALVVSDPPPPTRWQRLVLRLVEFGLWPRVIFELLAGLILLAALAVLALLQSSH
jgi:hypothetical protein